MTAFLLSVHVLAAILTIGPVAIAASMFPPALRAAAHDPGNPRKTAAVAILHRITRVYAVIGAIVPVFGVATGASLGVLGDAWLITSMILTASAAAVLIAVILPTQRRGLESLDRATDGALDSALDAALDTAPDRGETVPGADAATAAGRSLAMATGVFNLLWAIVVVLMIYRPGSTTEV
jgi:uncharacterized membrane protein